MLGWAAAAAGSALSIPQLVRILRERTSAGLSLLMWQLNLAVGLGWTHHGFLVDRPNVWAPNIVMAVFSVLIVRLVVRDRGLGPFTWALPLVLAAGLVGIDLGLGAIVYGVATAIPQVVGAAAQLVDVVRSIDIRGISPAFLVGSVVVQGLWFTWSLLAGEASITVAASATGSVVGTTLVWWVLRRTGLVRAMTGRTGRATA